MKFSKAFELMKHGEKVKLPSWGGYWCWDGSRKTIIMHTKDGIEMDIRKTERVEYTLSNIVSEEWIIADETNCPELGGKATFSFGEAIKYLKRGKKVKREGWNGKNQYIQLATGISYKTQNGEIVNCEHDAIGNMAVAFVGTSGVYRWAGSLLRLICWQMTGCLWNDRTLHSHKRRRQACTELAGEPDQLQDNQVHISEQRRTRRTERGEDWR